MPENYREYTNYHEYTQSVIPLGYLELSLGGHQTFHTKWK